MSCSALKRPVEADRPFPWVCNHCGAREVFPSTASYQAEVKHDGRLQRFPVAELTAPTCRVCGERVFTESVDQQVRQSLRSHLHLLTPSQIGEALGRLNITIEEAAERLGIDTTTLDGWLTGAKIQSKSMDNLLRVFLAFPQVRAALCGPMQNPILGTTADSIA
jgi:DNA-binding transcriptional regulator YiaG